jgi:hypothetical protein
VRRVLITKCRSCSSSAPDSRNRQFSTNYYIIRTPRPFAISYLVGFTHCQHWSSRQLSCTGKRMIQIYHDGGFVGFLVTRMLVVIKSHIRRCKWFISTLLAWKSDVDDNTCSWTIYRLGLTVD